MASYDQLSQKFLLIKEKLKDDKIFFCLKKLVGDCKITYGAEAMVLLDLSTYSCVSVAELANNTPDQLHELLAVRMTDTCEGVIERLKEIQIKLEGVRHAPETRNETKTETDDCSSGSSS